jgi:hypothetical protein
MKASVQYNDFKGSSAADISDHTTLNGFLESRGVNIDRYNAVGAQFYAGYSDFFSASIICKDNQLSTDTKKHIVSIGFENELSKEEFFELFKRFNVIITERFGGYENLEIEEAITINDRETD